MVFLLSGVVSAATASRRVSLTQLLLGHPAERVDSKNRPVCARSHTKFYIREFGSFLFPFAFREGLLFGSRINCYLNTVFVSPLHHQDIRIGCDLWNLCVGTCCRNRSARVHPTTPTTIDRLGIRYDPEKRWTEPPSYETIDKEPQDKEQQYTYYRYAITRRDRIAIARFAPTALIAWCAGLTL